MAQDRDRPGDRAAKDRIEPGDERRAAPRLTLLMRVAKLIVNGRELPCILRDASPEGVRVRLLTDLPDTGDLVVETVTGDRFGATITWRERDHAGLRFHTPVDLHLFIEGSGNGYPRQQVRLRIALSGLLHSAGEPAPFVFEDISQQGACIESAKHLLIDELVRLDTAVTPPLYAKVCWRDHPRYGLLFEQIFRLEELARIVAGAAEPDRLRAIQSGFQSGGIT